MIRLTDVGGSATVCPTGLSDWSDRQSGVAWVDRTDRSVRRSERVNTQLETLQNDDFVTPVSTWHVYRSYAVDVFPLLLVKSTCVLLGL